MSSNPPKSSSMTPILLFIGAIVLLSVVVYFKYIKSGKKEDCKMSDWVKDRECDETGKVTYKRSIVSEAKNGGKSCGDLQKVENCQPTDLKCIVTDWSDWSSCSKECGVGKKTRSRSVVVQAKGKYTCPELVETADCNTQSCKSKSGESCILSSDCDSDLFCGKDGKCQSEFECDNSTTVKDCTRIELPGLPEGLDIVKGINSLSTPVSIDGQQTREGCRQLAKNGKYKAWGFRNSNATTGLKNTCFLYKDFLPFVGDNNDKVNVSGCTNEGEKLSLGCNNPSDVFAIQQSSSTKCLVPDPRADINNKPKLVFASDCSQKYILTPDETLKHISSGKCLSPESGRDSVVNNESTVFVDDCKTFKYGFNSNKNLIYKNNPTVTCLHPNGGSTQPADFTTAINYMSCGASPYIQYNQKRD